MFTMFNFRSITTVNQCAIHRLKLINAPVVPRQKAACLPLYFQPNRELLALLIRIENKEFARSIAMY